MAGRYAAARPALRWGRRLLAGGLLLGAGAAYLPAVAQQVLRDVRPPGSPQLSDVVFSPRSLRPESYEIARRYGATRAEWIYVADWAAAAGQLQRLPGWIGLTLNANPKLPQGSGYVQDFNRTPIRPPWLPANVAAWVSTGQTHLPTL